MWLTARLSRPTSGRADPSAGDGVAADPACKFRSHVYAHAKLVIQRNRILNWLGSGAMLTGVVMPLLLIGTPVAVGSSLIVVAGAAGGADGMGSPTSIRTRRSARPTSIALVIEMRGSQGVSVG